MQRVHRRPEADRYRSPRHPDAAGYGPVPEQIGGAPSQRDHPETSRAAARQVRVGSQHYVLLAAVAHAGDNGLNAYEATPFMTPVRPAMPVNQTNSRMGELRERGLVMYLRDGGKPVERKSAKSGGIVHVITDDGRKELARIAEAQECE